MISLFSKAVEARDIEGGGMALCISWRQAAVAGRLMGYDFGMSTVSIT